MLSPLLELDVGTSISFLKLLKLMVLLIGDVSKNVILLLHSLHLFSSYWRVGHSLFIGRYVSRCFFHCPAGTGSR